MSNSSRLSAPTALNVEQTTVHAKFRIWICALAAALYPLLLDAFHWCISAVSSVKLHEPLTILIMLFAAIMLIAAFAVPLTCLTVAGRSVNDNSDVKARRFALFAMTAPTAYVFFGVVTYMLGSKLADAWIWTPTWLCLGYLVANRKSNVYKVSRKTSPKLRVAHGVAGSFVAIYVLFHIFNHMFGLIGPDAHAAVMEVGRTLYRNPFVEPLLVSFMLFQILTGLRLSWTWCDMTNDPYRVYQVATGTFMSLFILGHMNSVFVFARTYLEIPTDWAFAAGLPTGLIHDPWNIRLLPHYALGVFFVLTHLVSGLRVVLLAHNARTSIVNKLWWAGVFVSFVIATMIICGMIGLRLGDS